MDSDRINVRRSMVPPGASFTSAGQPARAARLGARKDVTGIPVSVLLPGVEVSGPRQPGPSAVPLRPSTTPAERGADPPSAVPTPAERGRHGFAPSYAPRMTDVDRSLPIPPSEQPARLAALVAAVRARTDLVPRVGMVLGSGLGSLADDLEDPVSIPFEELPGWPVATAPGHAGRLLLGRLSGVPVVVLQGRFHLYEGNAPGLVVQPVLLFKQLGAALVILTNAAGGANPAYGPGTLMIISDHINLTGLTPLLGQNADDLGPRFADMTDVWAPAHRAALRAAGEAEDVDFEEGVYVGLVGPSYETPAEVRMLHTMGADAVGMSTVLEAVAARWVGLEVCGVSLVTNAGAGYTGQPLTHEEVLEAGAQAGPRLARVIRRFVAGFGGD